MSVLSLFLRIFTRWAEIQGSLIPFLTTLREAIGCDDTIILILFSIICHEKDFRWRRFLQGKEIIYTQDKELTATAKCAASRGEKLKSPYQTSGAHPSKTISEVESQNFALCESGIKMSMDRSFLFEIPIFTRRGRLRLFILTPRARHNYQRRQQPPGISEGQILLHLRCDCSLVFLI